MTWIGMPDGRRVDLVAPRPEQFTVEDVARGLSRCPRFAGHTEPFYSVAQHSVLASRLVERRHALAALLHDASEAYLGDLARPAKRLCEGYRRIEARLMAAIADRFDFPWPVPDVVKEVDDRLLMTERAQLQPTGPEWEWRGPAPYEWKIHPWSAEMAEIVFAERFHQLTKPRGEPEEAAR